MPRSRPDRTIVTEASPPSDAASDIVLSVRALSSGYGGSRVVKSLSIQLPRGTTTAIVGPNGAGKSTLLRTLVGIVATRDGEIHLGGRRMNGLSPSRRTKHGLVLCPEGRGLFASLSVEENLKLGLVAGRQRIRPEAFERMYEIFPILRERRSQRISTMSGGEQQMVSVARSLLAHPQVLLLDEPSLGLAIGAVETLARTIIRLQAEEGLTTLIVEQDPTLPALVAQRIMPMTNGTLAEPMPLAEAHTDALGAFFDRALEARARSRHA